MQYTGQYDYVEFVAEYAPYDLHSLDALGRTVDLFPHMSCMIKLDQTGRTYWAPRCFGAGIQNFLFADPRTVEDVEECVRSVRSEFPHQPMPGLHGVGMRRDVGFVLEGSSKALVQATQDAVVAIMIEKKQAVDDLDSLLGVPSLDMVQFGAGDYSMSIGHVGEGNHPKVKEAEMQVITQAVRRGIAPRVELISSNPDAKATGRNFTVQEYQDMGVKHFCMGYDVKILYDWWEEHGSLMNRQLGRGAPPCEVGYGLKRAGVPLKDAYSAGFAAGVRSKI